MMFLIGQPQRSSTAAVAPKTNATLSLPSLWLRLAGFLASRSLERQINTLPQGKFCSFLNFCWLWKHRSRFFRMRRKRLRLNIIVLITDSSKKGKKTERTKRRCYEKCKERWKKLSNERWIIQVEWICFYRLREHGMNMLKASTRQKVLSWACPCFPSPKRVVRRLKFIPSAVLLSSLRYRFAIALSGSLSDSFSPASRVQFSRQATKERRSRRFKSCDTDSLVRWRTHDLLRLDRKDTPPS